MEKRLRAEESPIPVSGVRMAAIPAILLMSLLWTAACGIRKPPVAPERKSSPAATLRGFQKGTAVVLSWEIGARSGAGSAGGRTARAEIFRLIDKSGRKRRLTVPDFESRSGLLASLDTSADGKSMSYVDQVGLSGESITITYAVRLVNELGQRGNLSNLVSISPQYRIAGPPVGLSSSVSQDAVTLTWKAPSANLDGSSPPNVAGYNVYRQEAGGAARLLNPAPIPTEEFGDREFDFGKDYAYFVRTVSVGAQGDPIESVDSDRLESKPRDSFAPEPPFAITIASSPKVISLFFAENLEKDVAGYKVFRSEEPGVPIGQWKLMTPTLLRKTTFQDGSVESGKLYYYYLVAVDKAGNESGPSEIVSERASGENP